MLHVHVASHCLCLFRRDDDQILQVGAFCRAHSVPDCFPSLYTSQYDVTIQWHYCLLCSLFFFEVVGLGPVYVSTISLLMPLGISLLALILQSMTQW